MTEIKELVARAIKKVREIEERMGTLAADGLTAPKSKSQGSLLKAGPTTKDTPLPPTRSPEW